MQVDPIKPTLKAPGIKLLKLEHEKLLSNLAFKFNLRRYGKVVKSAREVGARKKLKSTRNSPGDAEAASVGRCRLTPIMGTCPPYNGT